MRQLLRFMYQHGSHLAFGAILMAMSSFGQPYFVSLYRPDQRQTFGLSDGVPGGLYAAGTVLSTITVTWVCRLIDYTTDLLPENSHRRLLAMSVDRSKRTLRSHLRFALNSFLTYFFRPSARLASPDSTLTIFGPHTMKMTGHQPGRDAAGALRDRRNELSGHFIFPLRKKISISICHAYTMQQ